MIKIRLSKRGAKNSKFYRVVVTESKTKATSKYLENIGFFNPSQNDFKIDKDAYKKWVEKGAVVADSIKKLLAK